jgi:hypothetical protein
MFTSILGYSSFLLIFHLYLLSRFLRRIWVFSPYFFYLFISLSSVDGWTLSKFVFVFLLLCVGNFYFLHILTFIYYTRLFLFFFLSVTCGKQLSSYTWKLVKRSNRNKTKSMQLPTTIKMGKKKNCLQNMTLLIINMMQLFICGITSQQQRYRLHSQHISSTASFYQNFLQHNCEHGTTVGTLEITYLITFFLLLRSEIRSSIPTNTRFPH